MSLSLPSSSLSLVVMNVVVGGGWSSLLGVWNEIVSDIWHSEEVGTFANIAHSMKLCWGAYAWYNTYRTGWRIELIGCGAKKQVAWRGTIEDIIILWYTSPTASGKGLRRLAQCVWLVGCDFRVVMFLDSVVMWNMFWWRFLQMLNRCVAIKSRRQ